MKAWAINNYGEPLHLLDFPEPVLKEDEVLIDIQAASINPVDFKIQKGDLKRVLSFPFPLILGNDCSGRVISVGSSVTRFKPGDEVYTRPHKEQIGTLAEKIAVKENALARKPKNLSFEEAASLPLVGLTSYQALLQRAKMKRGDRVFIPAGSGGVGAFAIQLAKYYGAYVITTTSTKNVEFVKTLGADEVIDYTKRDFSSLIGNVDIVFDTMGGEHQNKSFRILKRGGVLISIVGPPTAAFVREAGMGWLIQLGAGFLGRGAHRRAKRHGASYQFFLMQPDGMALEKIADLVEQGAIRPTIDKVYPFNEALLAMAHVEGGRTRGKVVVSRRK